MVLGAGTGVLTARHFRAAPEPVPDIQGLLWPDPKLIAPFTYQRVSLKHGDGALAFTQLELLPRLRALRDRFRGA